MSGSSLAELPPRRVMYLGPATTFIVAATEYHPGDVFVMDGEALLHHVRHGHRFSAALRVGDAEFFAVPSVPPTPDSLLDPAGTHMGGTSEAAAPVDDSGRKRGKQSDSAAGDTGT